MYTVGIYHKVRHGYYREVLSKHELSRRFVLHRKTIRKIIEFPVSLPPGYRRNKPPSKPKLDPYLGVIDWKLESDKINNF